jgi:hypothetical protein
MTAIPSVRRRTHRPAKSIMSMFSALIPGSQRSARRVQCAASRPGQGLGGDEVLDELLVVAGVLDEVVVPERRTVSRFACTTWKGRVARPALRMMASTIESYGPAGSATARTLSSRRRRS